MAGVFAGRADNHIFADNAAGLSNIHIVLAEMDSIGLDGQGGIHAAETVTQAEAFGVVVLRVGEGHLVGGVTHQFSDLDAIKVSAVPVPAGVLLLGTALAGLGVARRKA